MGELWYDVDWEEPREFSLLRSSRLVPESTVFDCGAHYGVVAALLAHEVPGGRVIAIEGLAHNAGVASRIVERNALANVEIVHAAVSSQPGEVRFSEQLNGSIAAAWNGSRRSDHGR